MKKLPDKRKIKKKQEQKTYHAYTKGNSCFNIQLFNTHFFIFNTHIKLLKNTPTNKENIPKNKLIVNAQGLNFGFLVYNGTIIAAPNHPAERFINKSDSPPNQTELINPTLTISNKLVKEGQIDTATQVKTFRRSRKLCLYTSGAIRYAPTTGSP